MRPTVLALAAILAAGCGGDEPEQLPQTSPQPSPRQRADTTLGDTIAMAGGDTAGAADQAQRPGGTRGREQVQGQAGSGETGSREAGSREAGSAEAGPTVAAGERLYTVQVAAFTEPSSASEWEGRLQRQGLPVWTSMAELGGRTFYRLRVGAIPTVAEARRLGTMISEKYEWPVWVAPLTPADRIPQQAVEDTRRILHGG